MTAISSTQILRLARAYSAITGLTMTGVGQRACGNNRVFDRLAAGHGANVLTLERAAQWFGANWPDDADWPDDVPRIVAEPPPPLKPRRALASQSS